VVEAGSFSGAARQMGCTQPAVSQAIDRLEEIYGGKLFERRPGTPLALTPIGEAILPSARILLNTVDRHMAKAVAAVQAAPRSLTIGLLPALDSEPIRFAIRQLCAADPDARLHLVEGSRGDLENRLYERKIDVLFATGVPGSTDQRLMRKALWQERLAIIMKEDHPVVRKAALNWSDVSALSLILCARDDLAASFLAAIEQRAKQPIRCMRQDVSQSMLMNLAAAGLGQTIVLASAHVSTPGLVMRPIDCEHANVTIEALWPRSPRNPLRYQMIDAIQDYVRRA
jgi:LysR family hydrogen peroxide-inducible transcriptional activator